MADERPPSVIAQRKKLARARDPQSLVASAALMTGEGRSGAKMTVEQWQHQAWEFYDSVGELRFGCRWISNAMSRVNLVAAKPPENQGDEPTPIAADDATMRRQVELVEQIAGGVAGHGQLLASATRPLTVVGLGYIYAKADPIKDEYVSWEVLSNEEAQRQNDTIQVTNSETGAWEDIGADDLLIKVWQPHPRKRHEPDSPVKALRDVLTEIVRLSQRIAADATSRLAGNGLLVMPNSAEFPPGQPGMPGGEDGADEFIQTFVQVTQIPIKDQSSPAATTPLIVKVPDEAVEHVQHITFYSDFDAALDPLRQSAIKRLALGLDTPPEVLLGMGDSNHWSAWQISEEAITMVVEPLAEMICHALTKHYLRNALESEGLDPDSVIVWYDTSDLTARPDHSKAAETAQDHISIAAFLNYLGLSPGDVPDEAERSQRALAKLAFSLTGEPALAVALLEAAGVIDTKTADAAQAAIAKLPRATTTAPETDSATDNTDEQTPPERSTDAPTDDDQTSDTDEQLAAAAVVAAADGIIVRALEVAGNRLRSAAGKKRDGGAAAVACQDPTMLHTQLPATEFASLDVLLAGAWERVPAIATRYGYSPESLTATLSGYARGLIAAQAEHTFERLTMALNGDHRH